jgi:hypothetical protein
MVRATTDNDYEERVSEQMFECYSTAFDTPERRLLARTRTRHQISSEMAARKAPPVTRQKVRGESARSGNLGSRTLPFGRSAAPAIPA